jgi:hypothetical protein
MSLPVGTWSITTDTLGAGTLTISSVDASGNVAGSTTIPSSGAVVGFFDAGAQTVSLSNVTNPTKTFVVFSAAVFQVTSGSSKTSTTTDSVLAGTYESYPPGTATSTGRWVASLSQKVKEKDKEEKEKEQSKDTKDHKDLKDRKEGKEGKEIVKENALDKLPESRPATAFGDPSASLQQLELRIDAIEQRLATGQAFIGTEERPEVGNQAIQGNGE